MSEIKSLEVEVTHPDILDVDVVFGQTLTKIVAPEHYMGPFEFYASDEDQVILVKDKTPVEDIVIKAEEWDGILYPPPDGLGFYIKQVLVHPGERLKIEGLGHGGRWWSIRAGGGTQNRNNGFGNNFGVLIDNNDPNVLISYTTPPFIYDTLVNIGGYEWRNDGGRYNDGGQDPATIYEYRGEYLKWKIIPAE